MELHSQPSTPPYSGQQRVTRSWIQFSTIRGMGDDVFMIRTLEGDLKVSPGDWIITGVKGEKYPCKPDIFALTYESAVAEPKEPV